jgi:maltose/moltooligosaccharide transporter
MMANWFHIASASGQTHAIPATIKYSFYIGAAALFLAMLWTIIRTKEYPPEDMDAFRKMKSEKSGLVANVCEVVSAIKHMPRIMRQLAWVQIFTWLGLFCMWLYFSVAVARNVLGAPDDKSPLYAEGIAWGGLCFSMYSAVAFVFSFVLVGISQKLKQKTIHSTCLICGAVGLLSVAVIHNKYLLLLSMTGVGIAWASIMALPFAILAGSLPPGKTGVYMGIFNFFVVLPEIAVALGFGWVMDHVLNNNRLAAVVVGGVFMLLAAVLAQFVDEKPASA